jgi:hypothetical protein
MCREKERGKIKEVKKSCTNIKETDREKGREKQNRGFEVSK